MKRLLITSLFFTGIALLGSCNSGTTNETADSKQIAKDSNDKKFDDKPMEDDAKFAVSAADGGLMEVQLGRLALTHAASETVKQFGQMMIDDHSKANDELKMLAATKNISIPDSLGEKNGEKYNDFVKKSGADFDKAYTDFMVQDHKEDIEEFNKEASAGNDPAIKVWAAGKITLLEHHLQMAVSAKDSVKKVNNFGK